MTAPLVLSYHAISETWPDALAVRPGRLEAQISRLLAHGYRAVTFHEALTRRHAGRRVFAVTFDDGYRSVLTRALPVMRRYGVPGTIFVPSDHIDAGELLSWDGIEHWLDGPHAAELQPLSWAELLELAAHGWEIGSHTRTHPRLTELGDAELREELCGSRETIAARLDRPCPSIAYPYGLVDARVAAAARGAGYQAGAALPSGRFQVCAPLRWPRVGIYHDDGRLRFAAKVSPTARGVRATWAWEMLGSMREVAQVGGVEVE